MMRGTASDAGRKMCRKQTQTSKQGPFRGQGQLLCTTKKKTFIISKAIHRIYRLPFNGTFLL